MNGFQSPYNSPVPQHQYNPYGNPYAQTQQPQPQPQAQQQTNILEVNGLDGAKAYRMQPNQRVALFDLNAMELYVKVSDSGGFCADPAMFDIVPKQAKAEIPQVDTNDLEARLKKYVEEYIDERIIASTPNTTSTNATSTAPSVRTTGKPSNKSDTGNATT